MKSDNIKIKNKIIFNPESKESLNGRIIKNKIQRQYKERIL